MQAEGTDNDKGGKLLVQREPSCLLDDVIVHALNRLNLLHAWISWIEKETAGIETRVVWAV